MRYRLADYEVNGPSDSDWYVIFYDDQAGTVDAVMTGTTRFPCDRPADLPDPTPEAAEAARVWLRGHIFGRLRAAEHREVLTPDAVKHGDPIRLTKPHRGTPAGTRGDVFWTGHFGRFFARGYNRPNRRNGRVGMRLPDGTRVFVPLHKVRLDREPAPDAELLARAEDLWWEGQFGAAFGAAWERSRY